MEAVGCVVVDEGFAVPIPGELSLEARGDAQFAAGQRDAARESYSKALAGTDEGSPQRRLIELKLSQVGGPAADTPAKPEA